jgi:hypothetical protein
LVSRALQKTFFSDPARKEEDEYLTAFRMVGRARGCEMAEDRDEERQAFCTLGERYRAQRRLRDIAPHSEINLRNRVDHIWSPLTDDAFHDADSFLKGEGENARQH